MNIDSNPDYAVDADLHTCIENKMLYLDAHLNWTDGRIHLYGLGFPLDTVINAVLDSIGDRLIRGILNRSMSGFKIQLLDLGLLFNRVSANDSEVQVLKDSSIFGLILEAPQPEPPQD